jgi:uncharacterized phage infection (PIP) family protein YhgE
MKRIFNRSTITNLDRFLKVHRPDQVIHNGNTIEFEWHDKLAKKLEEDIPKLGMIVPKMGKLQSVAQRIAATKQSLEAEADKLAGRLDEIDKKAPQAFQRGHDILSQHNADLDAMESELRQLSNLPLES